MFTYGNGTDSGIFKAPGGVAITADGIHLNPTGTVLAVPAVPAASFV